MKNYILLIILFAFSKTAIYSQNLIYNPSLENFTICPTNTNQIINANFWFGISVEYFHNCSSNPGVSTPFNGIGWQEPIDGNAYGGLYMGSIPQNGREIASVRLSEKTKNMPYCGGYYISKADQAGISTNKFGIYLTSDSLDIVQNGSGYNFPFPAQFTSEIGIVSDTMNWNKIEGVFIVEADLSFFHIGVFLDSTDMTLIYNSIPGSSCQNCAYYYFDNAYLYELKKLPQAQNHAYNCSSNTVTLKADTGFNFRWYYLPDTVNALSTTDTFLVDASNQKNVLLKATLCSTEFTDTLLVPKLDCTGIEYNALAQGASLFPNPASHVVNFNLQGIPPPGTFLQITDLNGKVLYKQNVTGKTTEVDVGGLSNGVYLITYHSSGWVIWKEKLAVIR